MHGHPPPDPFTLDAFRARAAQRLLASPTLPSATPVAPVPPPSDFDLNPSAFAEWNGPAPVRPAAVLVPIVVRDSLTVLLTERTPHLAAHAGQIAFPGGKPDPGDTGPIDTALREAEEEIGMHRGLVEPLGFLDVYRTGTGFAVTPVVALIRPDFALSINANEVAAAFEVPLAFLMDPANHRIDARTLGGRDRRFYAMPYGERYIWGATAGILRNMHDKLFSAP
ncbi:MAG: CoA pyrophosphatase [Hyphomicrobium sp. 32-62-53]|nr:MAG: CoA pyrophosphatase [Hyphomicrobium sp. 12-62-95]OYY00700.1 MAG: CoA pyrophosphatase [Hyphomicrobium sp. 32-62-53]